MKVIVYVAAMFYGFGLGVLAVLWPMGFAIILFAGLVLFTVLLIPEFIAKKEQG